LETNMLVVISQPIQAFSENHSAKLMLFSELT